jgi:hypothetical protein
MYPVVKESGLAMAAVAVVDFVLGFEDKRRKSYLATGWTDIKKGERMGKRKQLARKPEMDVGG